TTGGVAWLVAEALRVHDDHDCRGDAAHLALRDALHERIAHRIDLLPPAERDALERICLDRPAAHGSDTHLDALHDEGLLLRGGMPVPVIRDAVQSMTTAERFCALVDAETAGDVLVQYADR